MWSLMARASVAQLLELRKRGDRLGALVDEVAADVIQRALKLRVGKRAAGVLLEVLGGDVHRRRYFWHAEAAVRLSAKAPCSPPAGSVSIPPSSFLADRPVVSLTKTIAFLLFKSSLNV